jgi:hypothetical protein
MVDFNNAARHRIAYPLDFEWAAHGIGMLRTYLDDEKTTRLNLWHSSLINPGISTLHTHPWQFRSYVLCGRLENTLWDRVASGQPFHEGQISCGPHFSGIEGEPALIALQPRAPVVMTKGFGYMQYEHEIHSTQAEDGTATVMIRGAPCEGHRASVFWPAGEAWGDASRQTTREDVLRVTDAVARLLDL